MSRTILTSGVGGAFETCTSLGLEDRDEVDRLDVGLVFTAFLVGNPALVAFAGQLVDVRLGLGVEAVVDELPGHIGREDLAERVEETVENGGIECLH